MELLSKLYISEIEATIYISLLDSGLISITDIAKRTGIPRTTVHENIGKLLEMGMVTYAIHGKTKKIAPEPPNKLKVIIADKLANIENNRKEIK
ncbi:MAG: helix-turn-helix domain-containing protein [Candidatus Dojkabacteria bacterium]|nr:helix-turn-helix domain-containing protein [Candidatus Dojkabacteria bacterium]MDQ7020595.1 helix-turn-helix domain-containing protein [Candidatus Dojkabacteria bacterium]